MTALFLAAPVSQNDRMVRPTASESPLRAAMRHALESRRLTQDEVANRMGRHFTTVSRWLRGERALNETAFREFATALGSTPNALLAEWRASQPQPARQGAQGMAEPLGGMREDAPRYIAAPRLPVYGLAAASPLGQLAFTPEPIEWVDAPARLASVRGAYALIVTGTSMQPRYDPGDMVFLHPHQPPRANDDIAIQEALDGGVAVSLKRFVKWEDGHLVAEQFNPPAIVRYSRTALMAVHRVLSRNELVEM